MLTRFRFYTRGCRKNLLPCLAANGHLRNRIVGIRATVFHPPDIPRQIEKYFRLIPD